MKGVTVTKIRAVLKKSEWKLSKHEFYTAYHYALQYNDWKSEAASITFMTAIPIDDMPHGTNVGNPTEAKAMRRAALTGKMSVIESLARTAGGDIYKWLLLGVTNEGYSYNYLRERLNIPCGKDFYYDRRRKFYYLLNKKLEQR